MKKRENEKKKNIKPQNEKTCTNTERTEGEAGKINHKQKKRFSELLVVSFVNSVMGFYP